MSDNDEELDGELSDAAIDAEIARRTRGMNAESARLDAEAGPVSLGIEGLSKAELDELILARSGEIEATSPAVKAALAAGDALASDDEDGEQGPSPDAVIGMTDDQFADYINRNRSYAEGGK